MNKGVEVGKLNSSLRKGKESRISRAKGVIKLERGVETGLEEDRIWTWVKVGHRDKKPGMTQS